MFKKLKAFFFGKNKRPGKIGEVVVITKENVVPGELYKTTRSSGSQTYIYVDVGLELRWFNKEWAEYIEFDINHRHWFGSEMRRVGVNVTRGHMAMFVENMIK